MKKINNSRPHRIKRQTEGIIKNDIENLKDLIDRTFKKVYNYDIERHLNRNDLKDSGDTLGLKIGETIAECWPEFKDNNEFREKLKSFYIKQNNYKDGFELIDFVFKLIKIIEHKDDLYNSIKWDLEEKKMNLIGLTLERTEINDEYYYPPINNPYARESKDKLEEVKQKLPRGQSPVKAERKYTALAYVLRAFEEFFGKKNYAAACRFLRIPHNSFTSWKNGTDKYGLRNQEKFDNWFKTTPKMVIKLLEEDMELMRKPSSKHTYLNIKGNIPLLQDLIKDHKERLKNKDK